MVRLLAVLLLLAPFVVAPDAHAISATCLPGGFPTTTSGTVSTTNVQWGTAPPNNFRIDVWRVACEDGSGDTALLLKATPISSQPFVCSSNFDISQSGQQFGAALRQPGDTFASFCGELLNATTFSLERSASGTFDNTAAFTLVHDGFTAPNTTLNVPAGSGVPTLHITIVSTGCNPCNAGQLAAFHIHVVNPGGPVNVELKTGLRFPNGGALFTLLGVHVEDTLESGEFDIPLASIVVPGDAPNGAYGLEAAILEPILGTTLSRHSVTAVKQ